MAKVALLIGVSEYEPGLNPLPGAVKDVEAMQQVLAHPEMGGFAKTDIVMLKNPHRQAIEDAIYNLFANRQKEDLLLFYFSGHGVKDDRGNLYLSTRATRKENGKLVKPTAVAVGVLHESINESKSQRQVVILDCCFSGAIAQGMIVKDDGIVNLQEHLGGKGRAILTSSTQYSFEQEGSELSIYTHYLVQGITNGAADLDGDGWISVDELHEYARIKVQEAAPAMTPRFYPVAEGYRIRIAKSPKDDPRLKYRKELESRAKQSQGKFSVIARRLLSSKRIEWGISPAEAQIIEDEVLQPYREYQRKLQEYEQALIEAVDIEYPFSPVAEADLKEYQQHLALRDEDVATIATRVISAVTTRLIAPPKADYERSFKPRESVKQWQTPTPSPLSLILPFDFEVATLSIQQPGYFNQKIACEINRRRGRGEFFPEDLGNGVILEMVAIPGGTFLMGSPEKELGRFTYESPQHSVTVKSFFLGKFPVTQAQWQAVADLPKINIDLNPHPSHFRGAKRPVEQVSWYEAMEFCGRLSQKTEQTYRLPSEAEWEYACRAGTTTPFHFGETISTDLANYCGMNRKMNGVLHKGTYGHGSPGLYREQTTEVGSFSANAFGLYDMHGNVWEWCADRWHESYDGAPTDGSAWLTNNEQAKRLLRGGSWLHNPKFCRSAIRNRYLPSVRNFRSGFRVAVVLA